MTTRAVALFLLVCAGAVAFAKGPRHSSPARRHIAQAQIAPITTSTIGEISVDINPSHALNHVSPLRCLGAGLDSISAGSEATMYSAGNVAKMLGAGIGNISYRLYTELSVQAWHWNPVGNWSDSAHQAGYFTGARTLGNFIEHSYGYALPHRGSTMDQGDNLDYSRLTDGDLTTYWKSNPYLTSAFTHEADSLHPQWIVVDLGSPRSINAVRLYWANPYAVSYRVQYWTGSGAIGDPIGDPTHGQWSDFPNGVINSGMGGTVTLRLASNTVDTEFVRVLMTRSSNTYDTHGTADRRNGMGYAMYEIGVGTIDSQLHFTDKVVHRPAQTQTTVYVSSTDPWHRVSSVVWGNEQPGLDFVLKGALTRGLPSLVPVPMVYDTPENAVAEIRYLEARNYPLLGVELGEEPDGQYMLPEDYGALYLQWAAAIHSFFPALKLGGPVLSDSGVVTWADSTGDTDWLHRFVKYLRSHSAISELSFVSVEHYPFDATTPDWTKLLQEPEEVQNMFQEVAGLQLPPGVPLYVTEYNFNGDVSEVPQDLMGAIWQAEFLSEFLARGGKEAYYYQYLPLQLLNSGCDPCARLVDCGPVWGATALITADCNDQARYMSAQFFSSEILGRDWFEPVDASHTMFPASSSIKDSHGNVLVRPYALLRPDGEYAVLLINVSASVHYVRVHFSDSKIHRFLSPVSEFGFDSSNYAWHANGPNGYAHPDGPPAETSVTGGSSLYTVPARSIVVLRGRISQ